MQHAAAASPDPESTRPERLRIALQIRPHALNCLRHFFDLRASGTRPPPVMPSDILRRADSLSRAGELAKRMPVWPFVPPPPPPPAYKPNLYNRCNKPNLDNRSNGESAWHRDESGKAVRNKHGTHARCQHRDRSAIDDSDDGDF